MDADVVVIKSFRNVPSNFAGAEDKNYVASGVIGFERYGRGHQIAEQCLKKFVQQFNGNSWSTNGPKVITNVLKQSICRQKTTDLMTIENCRDFKVYRPEMFYAIPYTELGYFFEVKLLNQCVSRTQNSLLIHTWNKLSSSKKVGARSCYGFYAAKFCPKSYFSSGEYF